MYLYEKLQRFVLKTFELTFLELLYLGIPVSVITIIGTLAGLNVSPMWPMLVVFIGMVWFLSYIAMWALSDVWTIPIQEDSKYETVKKLYPR